MNSSIGCMKNYRIPRNIPTFDLRDTLMKTRITPMGITNTTQEQRITINNSDNATSTDNVFPNCEPSNNEILSRLDGIDSKLSLISNNSTQSKANQRSSEQNNVNGNKWNKTN